MSTTKQCYICGGAVRDTLLGLHPKDIDYVWTGITPDFLLAKGYTPVGADFPVFLDQNGDQHALARKERKVGIGYDGFVCEFDPSITIEDDLARRDLTINSLAVKIEDWDIFSTTKDSRLVIDPFWGQADLTIGLLIHTSDAFAEDPIRVLRTARFAARYGFQIDPNTLLLMRSVAHELNVVSTERIWAEFAKGLMEQYPVRMMRALEDCGAFTVSILEPFVVYFRGALEKCDDTTPLECRFALCSYDFKEEDYQKLSIPNNCSSLAKIYHTVCDDLIYYDKLDDCAKLELFAETRAFNYPDRIELLFKIISLYPSTIEDVEFSNNIRLMRNDLSALKTLDLTKLTMGLKDSGEIKRVIKEARLSVLVNR